MIDYIFYLVCVSSLGVGSLAEREFQVSQVLHSVLKELEKLYRRVNDFWIFLNFHEFCMISLNCLGFGVGEEKNLAQKKSLGISQENVYS